MNIIGNNRGVVLVFVAMGLLIFMLFLGLALDTGWLVYVRAQGQARIDSAALAAAAALIEPEGERENRAIELANVFGDKNSVVNSTVDPENVVTPMTYDENSGNLDEASGWELWGGNRPVCNAVRVTTTVPTPVFFAGIFGAAEAGPANITVSAVSHLPCPGIKMTRDNLEPMTLVKTSWSFPEHCGRERSLEQLNLGSASAALQTAIIEIAPERGVQVGDRVITPIPASEDDVQNSELKRCEDSSEDSSIVVVVDGGVVQGFAAICVKVENDEVTAVKLQCGEVAPNSAGVGECFGTYASNPILIR